MKISTYTRYGTHAMVELSSTWEGQAMSVSQIAERQKISPKYLEQIMARLKAVGLVISKRGIGYMIAKSPDDIYMDEVYKALETEGKLVDCREGDGPCPNAGKCRTKKIWDELDNVVLAHLSAVSLSDLAKNDCS